MAMSSSYEKNRAIYDAMILRDPTLRGSLAERCVTGDLGRLAGGTPHPQPPLGVIDTVQVTTPADGRLSGILNTVGRWFTKAPQREFMVMTHQPDGYTR